VQVRECGFNEHLGVVATEVVAVMVTAIRVAAVVMVNLECLLCFSYITAVNSQL
jgi:hypothetical protein